MLYWLIPGRRNGSVWHDYHWSLDRALGNCQPQPPHWRIQAGISLTEQPFVPSLPTLKVWLYEHTLYNHSSLRKINIIFMQACWKLWAWILSDYMRLIIVFFLNDMDLSMLPFYGFMIYSFLNKIEIKRLTYTHAILVARSSMNLPMASILHK